MLGSRRKPLRVRILPRLVESIPNFPPGRNSASGEIPFLDHWDQQDSVRPPGTTRNQWADATPLQGQPEATRGPRSLQVITRGNSSLTLTSHSRAHSTMRKSSTCPLPQASWQSSGKAETQMHPSWRFPCSPASLLYQQREHWPLPTSPLLPHLYF